MNIWDFDGKVYKDAKGNTYHIMGERILVNETTVLKSWFGCTTVADLDLVGDKMHVKFNTGELNIDGVSEIKKAIKSEKPKIEKVLGECSSFSPGCPKENLKALQKNKEE